MSRSFAVAVLAASSAATIAGISLAETRPVIGMMGGGCLMMEMLMGQAVTGSQSAMGAMAVHPGAGIGAVVEGRLAFLKNELGITSDQLGVWNAYAGAVKGRVDVLQNARESVTERMQQGSATDRMDARIEGLEAIVEAMKAVKPATEKLYAALNDKQKKTADELIGVDCGAM
ncbi:MAG: hypothetical protein EOR30_29570 [Mesorhizobium sp.]|uniref:Spy/CpxP family protein refolding chaperone n=1 Tax=unclassified Mesorhizobium TaxID=325217 RepID=UPI000FC9CBC8|nr:MULTISPECIES: Spy/CpxP family protein refolding chaperone [unclassified Mesorhizobium]RUV74803.1 hypothetical protein EOA78_07715 [Mesorhizobium sp. M5C.F.Cr.IN.023.01.1.1]RWF88690.1 MAG: hypothetical protein EOQ36_07650 [Mesorhizobium sp.]RWF92919.1 MAG: hypothetical protein EOQ45_19080 [Mesorhizobium sp.]RWI41241.1 MAG: hypothetical protein EOR14_09210 [Mesorhizobium sp.]RWI49766.1 MAG: hypothetical protein EOR15_12170 [Mesorhizobium sp.]